MAKSDDDMKEAVVLAGCADELLVSIDDGSITRLVPAKEGRPMPADATALARVRPGASPGTVQLTYLHKSGPPRISTSSYRKGWDAVFKKQLDPTLN